MRCEHSSISDMNCGDKGTNLLEYAKMENSDVLYHIDEVKNGLDCNCICPGCGSQLIARNGGKTDKSKHFAHYTGVESAHCLMTQLHLIAQYHFLKLKSFELPEVAFQYKGVELFQPKVTIPVESARLEAKIGSYFADVLLEFELFSLAIEVCVTHQNEDDKTDFYRKNCILSIEFDLSSYLNREIDDAIADLKENKVSFFWLYEWCRGRLIQEHEEKLAKQAEELRLYQAWSANNAAAAIEAEKKIRLPELGNMRIS